MGRIAAELSALSSPSPTGLRESKDGKEALQPQSEAWSSEGPEALRKAGGDGGCGPRTPEGAADDSPNGLLGEGPSPRPPLGCEGTEELGESGSVGAKGTPVFDSLKPRQQQAMAAYIDPSSPTHGNGTQSWKTAYKAAESSVGASVNMSRLLNSTNGQRAVRELMEFHSLGTERRIRKLSELVHGGNEQVVQTFNKDGELVRTVTSTGPQSDRLKAIDILNRMDGSYAEAEAVQSVAAEAAKQLIRANAHLLE